LSQVNLPQGEVIAAARELRQQNYKGSALEGAKAIGLTTPLNADTPAIKQYRDTLSKYSPGEKPDYVSLIGYALTMATVEGLRRIEGPINRQS
jgi:hypothetical protein